MAATPPGYLPSWLDEATPDAASVKPFSLSLSSMFTAADLARRAIEPQTDARSQKDRGIGIVSFLAALGVAALVFVAQFMLFVALRNKLARIFKPKTYLVPERERTEPPPRSVLPMIRALVSYSDRDIINKCGLDAYFFLRYLKTLLVIFVPICVVVLPVLIPINYIGGRGHQIDNKEVNKSSIIPSGLDTLAWSNVSPHYSGRYTAHLVMAILVVIWICVVFFFEFRVYIKVRQDYLTSAEHRLRASATTVLVSSIPKKWLSEQALMGLFDVFPGGVRNVWLNRDLTKLLDKISARDRVHTLLESAETELVRAAKKAQLKQRDAQERMSRKEQKLKAPTKGEKSARDAEQDAEANRMANSDEGINAGNKNEVPHTVDAGVRELQMEMLDQQGKDLTPVEEEHTHYGGFRAGKGLNGAATRASNQVNGTLGASSALLASNQADEEAMASSPSSDPAKGCNAGGQATALPLPEERPDSRHTHSRAASAVSQSSAGATQKTSHTAGAGNTVRKLASMDEMYIREPTRFWQFWKPPSGSYASPVPQGAPTAAELLARRSEKQKSGGQGIKRFIPFMGGSNGDNSKYPLAYNPDYREEGEEPAEWEKYLKKKDRPTHRLAPFGVSWLPGLPLFTKKVDTIYWCREELARLNLEIEEDQRHPELFPLMTSAFVQFNHQVAAHMACQSVIHHLPRQMSPRISEISPRDIVWDNMALTWWQEWLRTVIVSVLVCAMIFLWAIPVAWTAALSQLDKLIESAGWIPYFTRHSTFENIVKAIAGVLPAVLLAILLILVPIMLNFLAGVKGAKTGAQKSEFVQVFYFVFLFIQVFLVVSIASFFASSITKLVKHVSELQSVSDVLDLLARNLPAAANYFFSYMVLQALSTSSGTLLQIGGLLSWFIVAPLFDSTARNKWKRNTTLNQIRWGSFFPVYTNFACIGLVYSVIAPLISIFAIITFSLLWLAQRYAMLFVNRFEVDTGGVLYPRAINQTFTGIYFMELCMAGLFFIVQDSNENHTCATHGIIMLVVFVLTVVYQVSLNLSFSPLLRNLPITFEDEAVLRDEAFERAQALRFNQVHGEVQYDKGAEEQSEEREAGDELSRLADGANDGQGQTLDSRQAAQGRHLRDHVKQVGTWAKDGGKQVGSWAKDGSKQVGSWAKDGGHQIRKLKLMGDQSKAGQYRRQKRQKDLEAQRAMGEALYGGIHDDIEDLTPEERDVLTRHAFQHYALRARRPTVWIPRDDLGVSDDEIRRTKGYSEYIWISNEGTALDSRARVVYGKNPPDFSEVDIVNL